jgi:hypothetical protein
MVDVQRLRALQQEMRDRALECIDAADGVAMHNFADRLDALPALLAIAEAYNAAEVWHVDYRSADTLTLSSEESGGQTVRLVREVGS